jgi:hypothetical protein
MTWYNSLAMICPAAQQDACNRLMLAIGRGPNTFSRRIRDKVTLALVAFGAHTYDDELADCLNTQTLPAGITIADLQAQGFATAFAARQTVAFIKYAVITDRQAIINIRNRLDIEGWELEPGQLP